MRVPSLRCEISRSACGTANALIDAFHTNFGASLLLPVFARFTIWKYETLLCLIVALSAFAILSCCFFGAPLHG